jgi:hypothetical protein
VSEWERQEKRIAKRYGGKRQPGSGNGWLHQNDVKGDEILHEAKYGAKMVTVKGEDWEKVRKNAILSGRRPVMHIQIGKRHLILHDEDDPCPER